MSCGHQWKMRGRRGMKAARGASPSGLNVNRAQGSTLTEFAFVVPVLFAMLFGIIDFGRALYAYHFVSDAAREATRWASVRGSTCNPGLDSCPASQAAVRRYVVSIAPPGIDTAASKLLVDADWVAPPNALPVCAIQPKSPGCDIQVTVTYKFKFILPFLPSGTHQMASTAEMVISQ
jgi:Flp pilus assembly protein TadG